MITSTAGRLGAVAQLERRLRALDRAPVVRETVILIGLLLTAFIVTWPLGGKLFSHFTVTSDSPTYAWALWWFKERLFALEDPWTATELFAPRGTMVAFSAYVPLAGFLLSPLTALLGPAATLNLTKLFLPVLLSYVTYRLARRIGLTTLPALAAGVLYGCSAHLVYRADVHFNFAAGALIPPLALLFAVRYRQTESLREALALGVVLGAGMLVDPTCLLLAILACAAYALAIAVRRLVGIKRLALAVVVTSITALVFASPQLWSMKNQVDSGQYSTDVLFLAPSWPLYGQSLESLVAPSPSFRLVEPIRELSRASGESMPAYGWGLLILAVAGVALAWRRPLVLWLTALWAAATIISLGPTLKLAGSTYAPAPIERWGQELSAVMPYTWLVQLPVFADQRVAARYLILALLPAVLLAGFGVAALARRGYAARGLLALALVLAALDLGDPMAFRGDISRPDLYDVIRADKSDSIVVDVPLAMVTGPRWIGNPSNNEAMLRAAEHEHPIAYGVVGRAHSDLLVAQATNRFYDDLMLLQGGSVFYAAIPLSEDPVAGRRNARDLNVGWVVVQPTAFPAIPIYLRKAGFRLVATYKGVRLFKRDM